jgi:hypothetical protein
LQGLVLDPSGAAVSGAAVNVSNAGFDTSTTTDGNGQWLVLNAPSGTYKIVITAPGFATTVMNANFNSNLLFILTSNLRVGSVTETVEVSAEQTAVQSLPTNGRNSNEMSALRSGTAQPNNISANVVNLQRRVAGVLPVAIEVPRSGTSFKFVRPLVVNEETKVTFNYKNR